MHRPACLRLAAAVVLLFAAPAHGGELDPGPEHLWVGAGAGCGFDEIQDAIDAAGTARGAVIHIMAGERYGEALLVQGKDIAFQGGHVACGNNVLNGITLLSNHGYRGTHGSSVLRITGESHVSASRIAFVDGGRDSIGLRGGGIDFDGTGSLMLSSVIVRNNQASWGGGIAMRGTGGPALLWLLAGVSIDQNTVNGSGGGILLEGEATLRAHAPDISIARNEAYADGGGVMVQSGAHAAIGSGGGLALLEDNIAGRNGGGIALFGNGTTRASSLRVFSIDARRPTLLRGNTAGRAGGAIHAGRAAFNGPGPGVGVQICVSDTRIEDNRASEGAAVLVEGLQGESTPPFTNEPPRVRLGVPHDADDCPGTNPVAYGAQACLPGVRCNTVAGNVTSPLPGSSGLPSPGGTLSASDGAEIVAHGQRVQDNLGDGPLLRVQRAGVLRVDDSVVSHNVVAGSLLHVVEGGFAFIEQSTFAGNDTGSPAVQNGGVTAIATSILDVGDTPLMDSSSTVFEAEHVLASNFDGVPPNSLLSSLVGRARFVDVEGRNLRLAQDTLAIDFAPALQLRFDPDGNERGIDAPRADRHGTLDLGAYEWTPGFLPGRLFGDGLETLLPPG